MPPDIEQCSNCIYSRVPDPVVASIHATVKLECRCLPPEGGVAVPRVGLKPTIRPVYDTYWCGEWSDGQEE
jgi:hypothetical protein